MTNNFDLSRQLLNGKLADVLIEAAQSKEKRIYQTDKGIRALSPEEVKIDSYARLIGLNHLMRMLSLLRR